MNIWLVSPRVNAEIVKMIDEGVITHQTGRALLDHYIGLAVKHLSSRMHK